MEYPLYSWQDYDEPVTNTVRDFPLAASNYERKQWFGDEDEGRNERSQRLAQEQLARYASDYLSGKGSYQSAAESKAQRRRENQSPYGTKQVFDNFAIYTPPMPQMGGSTTSGGGGGGLFGKVGSLAGTLGTAAGVFGPLGAPIGAGIGGLIDMFA